MTGRHRAVPARTHDWGMWRAYLWMVAGLALLLAVTGLLELVGRSL